MGPHVGIRVLVLCIVLLSVLTVPASRSPNIKLVTDPAQPLSADHRQHQNAAAQFSLPEPSSSLAIQQTAAQGLLHRLLPELGSLIDLQVVSEEEMGCSACFELSDVKDKQGGAPLVRIRGTSGVDVASGLHWYLKYSCGAHISWDKTGGMQLETVKKDTDGELPAVGSTTVIRRPVKWSYYQNVCTVSYTMAWWDWARWEQEIDWMALQGINLPLAFTGQETIWQMVYQSPEFNLTQSDLDAFFGGPAFLAWARMANLHGWGGPLPQSWLDDQLSLQKKILQRMRELGMTPVLPGFAGGVPGALLKQFPDAKIHRLGNWGTISGDPKYCCDYVLDGNDPLFVKIGNAFVEKQIAVYGTDHIYNCDTFNENAPPSLKPEYITAIGAATYEGMRSADPDAIWLMQGWLFVNDPEWEPPQMKALLHSVPLGKLVVLDLYADVRPVWERSESFYGVPYIWCMLHNFGGNIEMYGDMTSVTSGPLAAERSRNSTMVGVGMCPEGLEQNPVMYELMAEMAFRRDNVELQEWVDSYASRRYGKVVPEAMAAWQILRRTVYNSSDHHNNHNIDAIAWFQTAQGVRPGVTNRWTPNQWYPPRQVIRAWDLLLSAAPALEHSSTYLYDLADVTRQVLSKYGNELFHNAITAFGTGRSDDLAESSSALLGLIQDMEEVLATRQEFLLGPWLKQARSLGHSEEEQDLLEWNARTQLTMWFDALVDSPSTLHDYANKEWSGLVGSYYLPRMALYMDMMKEALRANQEFPYLEFWTKWTALTEEWQRGKEEYSTEPQGDTLSASRKLFAKYGKLVTDATYLTRNVAVPEVGGSLSWFMK